jgi:hypothetical protein
MLNKREIKKFKVKTQFFSSFRKSKEKYLTFKIGFSKEEREIRSFSLISELSMMKVRKVKSKHILLEEDLILII